MSNQSPERTSTLPDRSTEHVPRRPLIRRWLLFVVAVMLVTAATAAAFWEPLSVSWRQSRARKSLRERHHAEALDALRAALRRDLDDPETLLLLARTYRRVGDLARVTLFLDRAAALGGDASRIERERRLVLAQTGKLSETEAYLSEMLVNAGDDGPDICEAYVQGYFANLRSSDALRLLDAWEQSYPGDPQPIFMCPTFGRA